MGNTTEFAGVAHVSPRTVRGTVTSKLKKLPEANEFSPGQLGGAEGARRLLELVSTNTGDRDAAREAVRGEFFAESGANHASDPAKRLQQQQTRAYNAILGAARYGLVDLPAYELTDLGSKVLEAPTADARIEVLAKSILKDRHGLEVLDTVRAMQARGASVTKTALQTELEQRGFELSRATTHHTKLLGWLREAGVVDKAYQIDDRRVGELAGVTLTAGEGWASLSSDQRAFLRTLKRLSQVNGAAAVPAKAVVDAVIVERGPIFAHPDQLKKTIFEPLDATGWIEHAGVGAGRGGKSGTVAPTELLLSSDLDLLPEESGSGIPPDLRSLLQRPLDEIYASLESSDTHEKGIGLELLALRLALDLGLLPVRLRERSAATGGAEVDLIADAAHLHFSRWLIQCKNTKKVNVAALAKEIGMAVLLQAQVVVLVTTGSFSAPVIQQAELVGSTTSLQVILVPGPVIELYRKGGPAALRRFFNDRARTTLDLKRAQTTKSVAIPSDG